MENAPGYLDRYVFYTRGKVPPGHEEWARRRLGVARWTAMLLLFEAVVWLALYLSTFVLSGGSANAWGLWVVAVFFAALAPISATYYSSKARRALGPDR